MFQLAPPRTVQFRHIQKISRTADSASVRKSRIIGDHVPFEKGIVEMIKKEIILRAGPKDVWRYITSLNHFSELWNSRIEFVLKKGEFIKLLDTGESVLVKNVVPFKSLSLLGGYGSLPILTSYSLIAGKNKTTLKIVVSGWEKIAESEVRRRLPALSFEWEKRLVSIKRKIESSASIKEGRPA